MFGGIAEKVPPDVRLERLIVVVAKVFGEKPGTPLAVTLADPQQPSPMGAVLARVYLVLVKTGAALGMSFWLLLKIGFGRPDHRET